MNTIAPKETRTKTRRFLLVGHTGSHNRGCEALVRTTVDLLQGVYPGSLVVLASQAPEDDAGLQEIPSLEIIPGRTSLPTISSISRIFHRNSWLKNALKAILPYGLVRMREKRLTAPVGQASPPDSFPHLAMLKPAMQSADLVISIGGDLFTEDYGPWLVPLETMEYAQQLGRPTMLWAASVWPLKLAWFEARVQQALAKCDLITVRDETSKNYLASLLPGKKVELVADGAFLMEPTITSRVSLPWQAGTPTLAFNGSPRATNFLGAASAHQILEAFISFLVQIIDEHRVKVVLVPHDASPGAAERDFLYELAQRVERPDSVYLPPIGLNAPETKALIGLCDLFIGMRFHPSIAALSNLVPTLGLSHSPKFAGLHRMVYGHTEYLINYENISCSSLISKFQKLSHDRETIRLHLNRRIPELKMLARQSGQYVKELLC